MADEAEVAAAVQAALDEDAEARELGIELVKDGIRQEEEWFYISVRATNPPPRRYRYYEALAEIECALRHRGLEVLLVPVAGN